MTVTGDAADVSYPFDRSRAVLAPAVWALAVGALSLLPVAVLAGSAAGLEALYAVTPEGRDIGSGPLVTITQASSIAAGALFLVAGVIACTWLVRIQRVAVRAGLLDRYHPESALWIVWVVPFANAVLPLRRLLRLDRAFHGRASWATWLWGVTWVWWTLPLQWRGADAHELYLIGAHLSVETGVTMAWTRLAVAVVGYTLWAVVVVRLTIAARPADAEATARVARSAPSLPAVS